jgi:ABC-type sugar transport system permease subunit
MRLPKKKKISWFYLSPYLNLMSIQMAIPLMVGFFLACVGWEKSIRLCLGQLGFGLFST